VKCFWHRFRACFCADHLRLISTSFACWQVSLSTGVYCKATVSPSMATLVRRLWFVMEWQRSAVCTLQTSHVKGVRQEVQMKPLRVIYPAGFAKRAIQQHLLVRNVQRPYPCISKYHHGEHRLPVLFFSSLFPPVSVRISTSTAESVSLTAPFLLHGFPRYRIGSS
jgi:hypothetical protein